MTIHETVINKLRQLPDSLAERVNDFIDLLLTQQDQTRWELWKQFTESIELAEADFSNYLPELEAYEDRLARGEIQW
jgi:hypothetical protein